MVGRIAFGPTRARRAWAVLGVDGLGMADAAPEKNYVELTATHITNGSASSRFPDHWEFRGGKTASYRQVGNAFPPPVAEAVARTIRAALTGAGQQKKFSSG